MGFTNNGLKLLGVVKNANLAAGTGVDIGLINLNSNKKYSNISIRVKSVSSSGTLAAATIGGYSAPSGGGTNIVTATAVTLLTGTNFTQTLTSTLNDSMILEAFYLRLTVSSLNAGTADFFIYGYEE